MPSTQKNKHFPIDNNHVVNKWNSASNEECIDMIKNNHDIWAIVGSGAASFGEVTIIHLPTIEENAKGDAVVRGFQGTSLGVKLEVEVSTDFLSDMVATVEPIALNIIHTIITLPDIRKCKKEVRKVGNTICLPVRSPVVIPLAGNVFSTATQLDKDHALTMAKACHLAVH